MPEFPAVDPIPLPAPVWLFKALHLLTLALHFGSVYLLLGGLFIGVVWSGIGRLRGDPSLVAASGFTAHRLPNVMAYVINLGVPPLLFAQVLYGRALYTSSILLGTFWISVILLVMGSYFFLYHSAKSSENGRSWTSWGLISLLLAAAVAFIYSNNFTLMLRPDRWGAMYAESPGGLSHNSSDPTVLPRFLCMMAGSIAGAGIGVALLSLKKSMDSGVAAAMRRWGAGFALVFLPIQLLLGRWVFSVQPEYVRSHLMEGALARYGTWIWVGTAVLTALLAAFILLRGMKAPGIVVSLAAVTQFLAIAGLVVARDALRDVSLLGHGFNVWERTVVTNWSVVAIFLGLFVAGLGFLGWMIWIVAKARAMEERYV